MFWQEVKYFLGSWSIWSQQNWWTPIFCNTHFSNRRICQSHWPHWQNLFFPPEQEDGQWHQAAIAKCLDEFKDGSCAHPEHIKYWVKANDAQHDEIISCQEIIDYVHKNNDDPNKDIYWKFKCITAHEGSLDPSSPLCWGSKYNVVIEWENGKITTEPLNIIASNDPVTCAMHAKEKNNLS